MGSMLPYIAAPWILWEMGDLAKVPVYSIGEMNWNGRTDGMKWDDMILERPQ